MAHDDSERLLDTARVRIRIYSLAGFWQDSLEFPNQFGWLADRLRPRPGGNDCQSANQDLDIEPDAPVLNICSVE
jgi:hypothetical protein